MAQFVFRPRSGQPTLLWLDSVRTARSTQLFGDHDHAPGTIADPNGEFLQLARDLEEREPARSWTTFFPPKIGDLVGGGGSLGLAEAGGLSAESQRSEILRKQNERSFKTDMESRQEHNATVEEGTIVPADANEATDGPFTSAGGAGEQGDDNGSGEEVGHVRNNDSPDGGYNQRGGRFTLPTESWAQRSAGRRGLYYSGTGGVGARADQSLNEQWPRKRSTGSTMRRDCRRDRLDLRSAAENQQQHPWTKRGSGVPGSSGCGPVGVRG